MGDSAAWPHTRAMKKISHRKNHPRLSLFLNGQKLTSASRFKSYGTGRCVVGRLVPDVWPWRPFLLSILSIQTLTGSKTERVQQKGGFCFASLYLMGRHCTNRWLLQSARPLNAYLCHTPRLCLSLPFIIIRILLHIYTIAININLYTTLTSKVQTSWLGADESCIQFTYNTVHIYTLLGFALHFTFPHLVTTMLYFNRIWPVFNMHSNPPSTPNEDGNMLQPKHVGVTLIELVLSVGNKSICICLLQGKYIT